MLFTTFSLADEVRGRLIHQGFEGYRIHVFDPYESAITLTGIDLEAPFLKNCAQPGVITFLN